jgi:Zn-dependent protease
VLGFPVEINLSFILLLAIVLLAWGGLAGVFVVCLAFGSVLLHELGHALVARKLGVHVSGIELSFFGGAAKMENMPRRPNHEIAIAVAGPIVSLVLAGAGLGLGALFSSQVIGLIGWINLVIAGFNLIPALPMDGGRILRALLARKLGYLRATDASVVVARVFTIAFGVVGLAAGMYQLLLLAPFLWMMTSQEQRIAQMTASHHGDVEVLGNDAWDRRAAGWGSPFDPRMHRGAPHDPYARPLMRRFTIVNRNGRLVIEAID